MSTSDIKDMREKKEIREIKDIRDTRVKNSLKAEKTALYYLLFTIFCAVFGCIYELFSHEVYSMFMMDAFFLPLIGGVLPFLCMAVWKKIRYPKTISRTLYGFGIVTLTIGSIIKGVLDIYGTTNSLCRVYVYVGAGLVIVAVFLYFIELKK